MAVTHFSSFAEARAQWESLLPHAPANTLYLTPQWQELWWNYLGDPSQQRIAGFCLNGPEGVTALASLLREGDEVSLMGNTETFDYNDFLIRPGYEQAFFETLVACLARKNIAALRLFSLPQNSPTLSILPELAQHSGFRVNIEEEDVAPGVALPTTWDAYLEGLSKKDRHELRRKQRRLDTLPGQHWECLTAPDAVTARLDDFLRLMRMSRPEKGEYMNARREKFFRVMARRMAELGFLRLFFLELETQPVATALCFDYGSTRMLYNSGYNPEHSYYSVGLLLNARCIKDAIEQGKTYFDFLRGSEPYKRNLGGTDRKLFRMVVRRS